MGTTQKSWHCADIQESTIGLILDKYGKIFLLGLSGLFGSKKALGRKLFVGLHVAGQVAATSTKPSTVFRIEVFKVKKPEQGYAVPR